MALSSSSVDRVWRRTGNHSDTHRHLAEKHIANIFSKLTLAPSDTDHRRVLTVLRYLES
jgi:hypothetical protein